MRRLDVRFIIRQNVANDFILKSAHGGRAQTVYKIQFSSLGNSLQQLKT